jgi:competence protein ComEC
MGVLILANALIWLAFTGLNSRQNLEVIFFNVGQGDSAFIQTPSGQQVLIDGGPDSTVINKLARVLPFYDRTIDLIILTHPEKDHIAGLLDVLKRYKVENIMWTGVVRDIPEWQEWEKLIAQEGSHIEIAKAGERVVLQGEDPCRKDERCVFFDILNPEKNLSGQHFEDSNDTSIVGVLSFGSDSFLFTGDISSKEEEKLLDKNIAADVLKVAHHGSKYSSSEQFLEKVSPKIAVIPVGENNYGHPSPDVLAKFKNFGINVLLTKLNGDIKIVSDGNNF